MKMVFPRLNMKKPNITKSQKVFWIIPTNILKCCLDRNGVFYGYVYGTFYDEKTVKKASVKILIFAIYLLSYFLLKAVNKLAYSCLISSSELSR